MVQTDAFSALVKLKIINRTDCVLALSTDTDRIISMCADALKVSKASKDGDIASQYCKHFLTAHRVNNVKLNHLKLIQCC